MLISIKRGNKLIGSERATLSRSTVRTQNTTPNTLLLRVECISSQQFTEETLV